MKKMLFSVLFYFFLSTLFAQNISVDKNNNLYIGLINPISITLCGYTKYNVTVKADKGIIKMGSMGYEYVYNGNEIGNEKITVIRNSDSQEIFSQTFSVRPVPSPVVTLPTAKNGFISKVDLTQIKNLLIGLSDFGHRVNFRIDSVLVLIIRKNDHTESTNLNIGGSINEKILNEFQNLNKGDLIIFQEVFVTGPGDKISRKIQPSTIIIGD